MDTSWRRVTCPPCPHLRHDHVLTLLHILALSLDDGVEEVEVLDVAAVRGQAVDEMLQDALGYLAAELVVVTEDVLHCLRLQQLRVQRQPSKCKTFPFSSFREHFRASKRS